MPFIGRLHDIPSTKTWLHFYKWSKEFGPIYKHELFGTTHVWITSERIAKDLLSKKGAVFSDRPLISNLPINKTGGEYLPLLGHNGKLFSCFGFEFHTERCSKISGHVNADLAHTSWYPVRRRPNMNTLSSRPNVFCTNSSHLLLHTGST